MTAFLGKKNNANSKVATVGGIDNSTDPVTFAVTTGEGSKFPASNFVITIDNEILLCTSRTGDSLTCTRAAESTTIAAHSQNADVELRVTAGTLAEYELLSKLHGMDFAADDQTSDTYAITLAPAPTAYFTGMVVKFKANTLNTGACTLNVNSLGAKTLKKNYNSDLVTGDILAGQIVTVIYDGTNFQVLSIGSVSIATGAEVTTGTDNTKVISPKALADATLSKIGAAYETYTVTAGGITIGNGSITGRQFRIGKICFFSIRVLLGSTSSITGAVTLSAPYNNAVGEVPVNVAFQDSGSAQMPGCGLIIGGTVYVLAIKTDGTYAGQGTISSTVPFTWANTDQIMINGCYETT